MALTWTNFDDVNDTNDRDNDETIKKFAIFMNNGQVITIDAFDYEWRDDLVEFYGNKFTYDNDNVIATFKTSVLYAVSQCCYNIDRDDVLMLPKYDDENSEEEEK